MAQLKNEKRDGNANAPVEKPPVPATVAREQLVPPEGGYGWFIVLAYAIANVSTQTHTAVSGNGAHASTVCSEWSGE